MSETKYNPSELLISISARLMEDNATCFIGTGIPMLAASLAQKMHAPNLISIFEFGGMGAQLEKLPLAVGDMRTFNKGLAAAGICDIMETAQRGFVEYGFLGGAQIDMYGNLNSTIIGDDHDNPKVRLPGSGGANDVGSTCWKTIIIMQHDKRRFIPKVDFITTPGYLSGPNAREKAGLAPNTGPYRVVTSLCTFGFDEETKWMKLLALNPGVTVDDVVENTGFKIIIPDEIGENTPPTQEELRILRDDVDKDRYYI
ncbi:MAG: 3-oxoacid CoA-transferase [Candidatus Marinimicrobia bacterium]|nr:3-oxoacid CoA-transferase [Candidatus Neomarinimicrobiota bacterium]MBL7023015.1 3-oxoacid CoA-transferase [Candidatus Neomarinimicrobiota bacterium]MBL7109655.1 3-oxoacid CoA-transferase [Candidatus Neomarinimicrobiota bacterium]